MLGLKRVFTFDVMVRIRVDRLSAGADEPREARQIDVAARDDRDDLAVASRGHCGESAAATAQAAAPSAMTCSAVGDSRIAAAASVERDDDRIGT